MRYLLIAAVLFPLATLAQETADGEKIFDAKCSQCHTFRMARAMLAPKPADTRPAYLAKFLRSHLAKLNENEMLAVIAALSQPDR